MFSTRQMVWIGYLLVGFGSLALVGAVVRGDLSRTFVCATAVYLAYLALQENAERLRNGGIPPRSRGGRPRHRGE